MSGVLFCLSCMQLTESLFQAIAYHILLCDFLLIPNKMFQSCCHLLL